MLAVGHSVIRVTVDRAGRGVGRRGVHRASGFVVVACAALLTSISPAVAQPAQPELPAVTDPRSLQQGQCAPPSTVVTEKTPWSQSRVAATRVWPITRGAGQVVAVIDTGVDGGVPQLSGAVLDGHDVVRGGNGLGDCVSHGTFVAGIIAARPVNGSGFAGVAPEARVLPVRQTTNGRDGTGTRLAAAIVKAVDEGARIINVSVSTQTDLPELKAAVDHATARGALIVAAVSNDAQNDNAVAYPAAYPQVLAVGAFGPDGQRANFSAAGTYVDVVAPGVGVVSTGPGGAGHLIGSGTSFAVPFVSGTVALVWARHPELTAAQVKHRIETTADHPAVRLPSPEFGWGAVNPLAAVTSILPEERGGSARPVAAAVLAERAMPAGLSAAEAAGLVSAGGAVTLLLLCAALVVVVPRGRKRGWRVADGSVVDGSAAEGGG